jgi:hypothetical protein
MKLKFLPGFLVVLLFVTVPGRAAMIYSASIDTTAWSGLNGTLAFDLTGGDAAIANNTATIGSFVTNGALGNSAGLALTDTGFFNEQLRAMTFGTQLAFTLQLTENRSAPGFDQFSFFILDPITLLPLALTTDPTGANAVFAIDLTGAAGGAASVFGSLTQGVSWSLTPQQQPPNNVPDAAHPLCLAWIAASALAGARFFHRTRRPARASAARL